MSCNNLPSKTFIRSCLLPFLQVFRLGAEPGFQGHVNPWFTNSTPFKYAINAKVRKLIWAGLPNIFVAVLCFTKRLLDLGSTFGWLLCFLCTNCYVQGQCSKERQLRVSLTYLLVSESSKGKGKAALAHLFPTWKGKVLSRVINIQMTLHHWATISG